jgi:hypothetical protein
MEFDRVFPPAASQADVFEQVAPLCTSFLDGFGVVVMAYGQTGEHAMGGLMRGNMNWLAQKENGIGRQHSLAPHTAVSALMLVLISSRIG